MTVTIFRDVVIAVSLCCV